MIRTVDAAYELEQQGYPDYFTADALDVICGYYNDRSASLPCAATLVDEWREYYDDDYVGDINDVIVEEWGDYIPEELFAEWDEDDAILAVKDYLEEEDCCLEYTTSGIIMKLPEDWDR